MFLELQDPVSIKLLRRLIMITDNLYQTHDKVYIYIYIYKERERGIYKRVYASRIVSHSTVKSNRLQKRGDSQLITFSNQYYDDIITKHHTRI